MTLWLRRPDAIVRLSNYQVVQVPMTSDGEPGGNSPTPNSAARPRRVLLIVFVVLSVGGLIPGAVQVLTGRTTDPGQIAMLVFAALVLLIIMISLTVMAKKRRRGTH